MMRNRRAIHLGLGFAVGLVALALEPTPAGSVASGGASKARLGPFVEGLADVYERGDEQAAVRRAALRGLRLRHDRGVTLVPVILEPKPGLPAARIGAVAIHALGGRVDAVSASFMRVLVPFSGLRRLTAHPDVLIARAPTPARELGLGSYESESVSLTGAASLQQAGITGAGVDAAVVDLGFIGLAAAIAAGELRADTVIVDLPGSCDDAIEAGTEHGVGVAEHVADMAPGATLHCIKVCDEVDLENAAAYLATSGVEIANHSVGWVNASYYDDTGPINAIINDSRDLDGVYWSVAAGNDAQRHWRGGWSDTDVDQWLEWSGADELNDLSSSSQMCLFLNWDQYGSSVTDLDLYVVNAALQIVAASEGVQNGTQDPAEAVCLAYDPAQAPYGVMVHLWSGPTAGLDLTLFSFYNNLEHRAAAASLMDPANAHGAVSVGAIFHGDYADPDPPPEPYSSQGPTTDGRLKPDLVAPDGTTSLTYGVEGSFGTSFAAPTVAGAAALLLGYDPGLGAGDLALALAHLAIDVGAPGPDTVYGAGKLQVEIRPACDDGVDNDGDGRTDFDPVTYANPGDETTPPQGTGDPACANPSWGTESSLCQDGLDNDGDGKMDYDAGFSVNGAPHPAGPDPECVAPYRNCEKGSCYAAGCGLGAELLLVMPLLWVVRRSARHRTAP